ncbi:MAG: transposase [Candidatus Electronema sp. V4]|uniref:transposase n=1 Tax=Candidatus Electronema sp. V4 TaxID=3454756 RepID=UPI0040557BD9
MTVLFPPGKGGGAEVAYGYKGKGVLIHLIADADGMPLSACSAPANKDERKQVGPLLDMIAVKTGKLGRPPQKPQRIAADKGYDSDQLKDFLKRKGIRPQIPRKKNAGKTTWTDNRHEISKILCRKNFFVAAEKILPSGCPMGKTAKMFRCFSLLGCLFYVDAAINGIGSCFPPPAVVFVLDSKNISHAGKYGFFKMLQVTTWVNSSYT